MPEQVVGVVTFERIAILKAEDGSFRFPWLWGECLRMVHDGTLPNTYENTKDCVCNGRGYVLIEGDGEWWLGLLRVAMQEGIEVRLHPNQESPGGPSLELRKDASQWIAPADRPVEELAATLVKALGLVVE